MPISNINRVKSIALKLPTFNAQIQTIYSNESIVVGSDLLPTYKVIGFSTFIKNLRVFASVVSLPEAALPDFALEDSQTVKRTKVLDVEWKSPRKQLNLFISTATNTDNDWLQVGSVSLLNPYGYPFRVYNVMDLFTDNLALELGENGKIGIQVQDVGYGLLVTEDKVVVHGSYTEEIFVQLPDPPNIFNINIAGITALPSTPQTYLLSNESSISNQFLIAN